MSPTSPNMPVNIGRVRPPRDGVGCEDPEAMQTLIPAGRYLLADVNERLYVPGHLSPGEPVIDMATAL